jgi:hypothetical protein
VRGYYALEEKIEWWAWSWGITKLPPEGAGVRARRFYKRLRAARGGSTWDPSVSDVLRGELGFSERLASIFSYMYGNHGRTPEHAPFAFHAVNLFTTAPARTTPWGGRRRSPSA